MFQRKPRRFRNRSNGRSQRPHGHGHMQRPNSYSNNQPRNNFRPTQSAEKLYEKYSTLAKEALSSGDQTSYENFLQHADHFVRIIEEKNKNKEQNSSNVVEKLVVEEKNSLGNNDIKLESNESKQELPTKSKD